MTNLMVDIETFGNKPTAVIQQIGWAAFDTSLPDSAWPILCSGNIFVSIDSCLEYGLTTNESCLQWWLNQSEDARKVACKTGAPLGVAIDQFNEVIQQMGASRYWCSAPSFDFSIIENAGWMCGKKIGWDRRELLCMRTIRRMTPQIKREEVEQFARSYNEFDPASVQHIAEDDAVTQALELVYRLRSKRQC